MKKVLLIVLALLSGCLATTQVSEQQIKKDIIKKNDIGTCFGMPGIVSNELMREELKSNEKILKHVSYPPLK